MLDSTKAFSGFSVNDLSAAEEFYSNKLGLACEANDMGLRIELGDNHFVFVYIKPDHTAASYTVLNFPVDNIDDTVAALQDKGITLERYAGMTDDKGVMRGRFQGRGPDIAWFKDPAGNILSVLQQ